MNEIITKEDFELYEEVRQSGVTNMFAINVIMELTGLSKEQIIEIMKNYSYYKEKYMGDETE